MKNSPLDYSQPHPGDPSDRRPVTLLRIGLWCSCVGWFSECVTIALVKIVHSDAAVITGGIGGSGCLAGIVIVIFALCIGPNRRHAAWLLTVQILVLALTVLINVRFT